MPLCIVLPDESVIETLQTKFLLSTAIVQDLAISSCNRHFRFESNLVQFVQIMYMIY